MKKLGLAAFREITIVDMGSFMTWLQKTGETTTIRKIKSMPPVRQSKLSFIFKLGEDFSFISHRDENITMTPHGKKFASAEFSEQAVIVRDLLMSHEPVREVMGQLAQSTTGRLKRSQIEEVFSKGTNAAVLKNDVLGFITWAHACELFNYDKKNEEVCLRQQTLPS